MLNTVHQSLMSLDGFTRYLDGRRYESSIHVSPDDISQLPEQSQVKQLAHSTFHLVQKERKKDYEPRGTGFFISSDGLAVVAKHCVIDGIYPHIPLRGALLADQAYPGDTQEIQYLRIVQAHEKEDVALVKKCSGTGDLTRFLTLDPDLMKVRDSVFKCGFPARYVRRDDIHLSQKRIVAGVVKDPQFDSNEVVRKASEVTGVTEPDDLIEGFLSRFCSNYGKLLLLDYEDAQGGFSGCPIVDEGLNVRAIQRACSYSSPILDQRFIDPACDGKVNADNNHYKVYAFGVQVRHVIEMLDDLRIDYRELAGGMPAFKI